MKILSEISKIRVEKCKRWVDFYYDIRTSCISLTYVINNNTFMLNSLHTELHPHVSNIGYTVLRLTLMPVNQPVNWSSWDQRTDAQSWTGAEPLTILRLFLLLLHTNKQQQRWSENSVSPQVEIPNIQKQRKHLAKLVLDMDSARTRWVCR